MARLGGNSVVRAYVNGAFLMKLARTYGGAQIQPYLNKLGTLDWIALRLGATSAGIGLDTIVHGSVVGISVRGTGLRSSDHLVVEVEQLLRATDENGQLTWKPGQPLYSASLGPDGSGNVAQTVEVPVPAGDFDDVGARVWVGKEPKDCYADRNTTGCVRVYVPRPQERPQLAVDWETFVRAPRVLIRLKARNLPQRPSRSMTLRVYGIAVGLPTRILAEWFLAPDADGVFDRHLSVVIGHAFSDVCIVASITTRAPACPAPVEDGTVWAQLAVPPA